MKKRAKEEEIEKGNCGLPTRKVSFWFCRTWTKRYLITSQTRVKRDSQIHHRTILWPVCIQVTIWSLKCDFLQNPSPSQMNFVHFTGLLRTFAMASNDPKRKSNSLNLDLEIWILPSLEPRPSSSPDLRPSGRNRVKGRKTSRDQNHFL